MQQSMKSNIEPTCGTKRLVEKVCIAEMVGFCYKSLYSIGETMIGINLTAITGARTRDDPASKSHVNG